ncbi:MAG: ribonuclease D [Wolbachia endosymbiont of Tyrophagus putrescentiae]|nr:ribonuclease D [Wolbachia endosymbiont of Tyrophagus putrescentiae]
MHAVNTTVELEDKCEELIAKKPAFIAVDTEFIRNNLTYYPKLSLVQISYGDKSFIVDALATDINLSPIEKILLNQEITKMFHSCRQDMESLLTVFKDIPSPIFDTQIAAMFCNYYHDFIGYSKLVEQYTGVVLDKVKAKKSDWLKRPLSQEQLDYAINDVTYLYDLYQVLQDELERNNRTDWFKEEICAICDINKYTHNPKNAWKRIKFSYEINPQLILIVKAVSEWQETLAQRYNLNRNKVVNNAIINYLIEQNLERIDEVLDVLKQKAKNVTEEDLLEFMDIFNNTQDDAEQNGNALQNNYDKHIFDMLSIILDSKCKENNISRKLVASKDDLAKSISGQTNDLFKGWRYNFFGRSIEAFINNKLRFEILTVKSKHNITVIKSREKEIDNLSP